MECNVKWHLHVRTAVTVYEFYPNELERFYALAQAQALQNAAEISDQQDRVGATGDCLRRLAKELKQ